MEPIRKFRSRIVPLPIDNVDTDQIIPARFLKTTTKTGLGKVVFCDWRFDAQGSPRPDFMLNQDTARGASILLAGNNFGCGSSREHAPWALLDFGFRAIISTSFADIFRNNCLKNGLLPIQVEKDIHSQIFQEVIGNPSLIAEVDLESQSLDIPGVAVVQFPIDAFSRACLLEGIDELGYLLKQEGAITSFENMTRR